MWLCALLTAKWTSLPLSQCLECYLALPKTEGRPQPPRERTWGFSILYDMKRKCHVGALSPALEDMRRTYSESEDYSLMSESYSIWLYRHRATLSNIVVKTYLFLNASEAKLLSKAEKKKNQSSLCWSLQWSIHATKIYFSPLFAEEFGHHPRHVKLKYCGL